MERFLSFVTVPLGSILNWIYENIAFHNYGFAIIVFTLIIKFALLPFMIKQQKSTIQMQKLQPQADELKKRYKDDQQRLSMEMMKLYQESGMNPATGCFTTLIQMPVLLSLFFVISKPLTYMKHMSVSDIGELASQFKINDRYREIGIVAHNKMINMNFLGLDLTKIPTLNFVKIFKGGNTTEYLVLLMLPILTILTTYLSFKLTMKKVNTGLSEKKSGSFFAYLPIVITALLSFEVPAGLAIYWIVDNLYRAGQQIYINKYVVVDK